MPSTSKRLHSKRELVSKSHHWAGGLRPSGEAALTDRTNVVAGFTPW